MKNIPSPLHLRNFTISIRHSHQKPFEWRGQLVSSTKNTLFKIKYYGKLHPLYHSLIVGTSFAPAKLVAIDSISNEEILLFDGCHFGYNALLCDRYSDQQIEERPIESTYRDESNDQLFELFISCYYQIDYDQEYKEYLDVHDQIELLSGQKVPLETLKRNGFDYINIIGINKKGETTEILSEELA